MELYPIKSVFGYSDLSWYLKNWVRWSTSRDWIKGQGIIEGYELHAAGHHGWLVVFYSYEYGGRIYSGELRRWVLLYPWSQEESIDEVISEFPRGSVIQVRLNPRSPERSVVESPALVMKPDLTSSPK